MSTPDQPDTPPLTRRQLREIRNTGATPVLTAEQIAGNAQAIADARHQDDVTDVEPEPEPVAAEEPAAEEPAAEEPAAEEPAERKGDRSEDESTTDAAAAVAADDEPETEPAVEAQLVDEPGPAAEAAPASDPVVEADSAPVVDLGVAPLTRRQAREQERIRTASVPIITPEALAAAQQTPAPEAPGSAPADTAPEAATPGSMDAEASETDAREGAAPAVIDDVPGLFHPSPPEIGENERSAGQPSKGASTKVDPHFGSGLLEGAAPAVTLPPSFDQLIARSATTGGSSSTPNALILSQSPTAAPLVAPVTATGEVLITGTFDLPEGLGSVGHAPGIHDGKDVDAVLVDGELPAASSPTPVAASAAISTVRSSDEIIRPPAPEKGSRLVLLLGIITGVLGLAAIAAFVLAFTTGAF